MVSKGFVDLSIVMTEQQPPSCTKISRARKTLKVLYNCNFRNFNSDFLLIDANVWIDNECSECMISYLNTSYSFTRLHPSKEENRSLKIVSINI